MRIFEVEHLIDRQVCNLSGGQLQRVLLSMAVMDEPNLLLLDEPVSGIDQNGMELFYRTMDYLKKNFDLAIILISHDLDYVAKYADKVLLLDKTILKQGTPKEVYASKEFGRIFGMEEECDAGCFYRMVRIRFYEKCTAGSSDHYSVIWNSWNDDRE